VAEILMNRPPVHAISHQLAREVVDAYNRALRDLGFADSQTENWLRQGVVYAP
jgi:enoyl-CoA hydratase/carnithine racemase